MHVTRRKVPSRRDIVSRASRQHSLFISRGPEKGMMIMHAGIKGIHASMVRDLYGVKVSRYFILRHVFSPAFSVTLHDAPIVGGSSARRKMAFRVSRKRVVKMMQKINKKRPVTFTQAHDLLYLRGLT